MLWLPNKPKGMLLILIHYFTDCDYESYVGIGIMLLLDGPMQYHTPKILYRIDFDLPAQHKIIPFFIN